MDTTNSTVESVNATTDQLDDNNDSGEFGLWLMFRTKEVISLFGVIGNAFMVLLYLRYKELRGLKPIYSLILLAVADMVRTGGDFLIKFMFAIHPTIWHMNGFVCSWFWIPAFVGSTVSWMFTLYVAFERLAAVKFPLRFRTSNIKKNAAVANIICWVIASGLIVTAAMSYEKLWELLGAGECFLPFFIPEWYWDATFYLELVVLVFCFVIYIVIFVTARKMLKATAPSTDKQAELQQKRERRLTQATMQVLTVYFLCLTAPSALMYIVPFFFGEMTPMTENMLKESNGVGSALNSSVNVLIYVSKCDEIQFHAKKFFGKVDKKKLFSTTGTTSGTAGQNKKTES